MYNVAWQNNIMSGLVSCFLVPTLNHKRALVLVQVLDSMFDGVGVISVKDSRVTCTVCRVLFHCM
jgi:hypothetical protein